MNRSTLCAGAIAALTVAGLAGIGPAANAATHTAYAEWQLSGQSGTVAVPDSDFPVGTFTSDTTTLRVPSGKSTYLNEATPFGAEFGSSRDRGYLYFGTAKGGKPSTTTIDFASPAPAGRWAFTLGDIDADRAKIEATGADGKPLTAAQLGWQGAFNYCAHPPRPSTCTRGVYTDLPHWDPATSTLHGNVTDTDGASGWFRPAKAVKSLTIVFSVQSGIPIGQLWIAAHYDGKQNLVIKDHAAPPEAPPGAPIEFVVIIKDDGPEEPHAEACDDLSRVLPGADYNGDAHASSGSLYLAPRSVCWHGPLEPGHEVELTVPVTIKEHPPVDQLVNVLVGKGPRMRCQGGRGAGCVVVVKILGINFCRADVGSAVNRDTAPVRGTAIARAAAKGC